MSQSPHAPLIVGVEIKQLKTFPDDRGFFREIIRCTDSIYANTDANFAQWSHSKMGQNTVKAWHFHHKQTDWWYVCGGIADIALYDNRPESASYKALFTMTMGDGELGGEEVVVRIPPGVLHGLKVMSDSAHLFYITSEIYNPEDEGRIPFDSKEVPHSWGDPATLTVAERDRKLFVPSIKRAI